MEINYKKKYLKYKEKYIIEKYKKAGGDKDQLQKIIEKTKIQNYTNKKCDTNINKDLCNETNYCTWKYNSFFSWDGKCSTNLKIGNMIDVVKQIINDTDDITRDPIGREILAYFAKHYNILINDFSCSGVGLWFLAFCTQICV